MSNECTWECFQPGGHQGPALPRKPSDKERIKTLEKKVQKLEEKL